MIHDHGRVVRAVDNATGVLPRPWPELDPTADLAAEARRLRAEFGVDRIVLAERSGLLELAGQLAATGDPVADQPSMLRASNRLFWESPAIVTDPAPPPDRWAPVADVMSALPSPASIVVIAFDGDRCAMALRGEVINGRLSTATSIDPPPESTAAAEQLVATATTGFVLQVEQLHDALAADDPWAALVSTGAIGC